MVKRVQIETYDACNLDCTVCDFGRTERTATILTLHQIEEILNHFKIQNPNVKIQFGYKSEFLVDKRAIEISKLCYPLYTIIWTNGILLESHLNVGLRCNEIIISILGGIEEPYSYNNVTKLSIEKTISTIYQIKSR
jgi:MoaA/NifB/PqqE/SkfB family radical SAM enzyme